MGTPRIEYGGGGGGGEEFEFEYVDRATSEMLLDKFADMSAYDFNYEESAIWSPLNPSLYNYTNTYLSEIKPKKKKQKQKQQGKLMKRFFRRSSRTLPLNSSSSSFFASAQKAQAWTRLLRVASRCFKGGRPSLSSSMRFLHLPNEISLSESLH
ncbi:hypothetical protein KI387_022403 [Taxus chinensis]|uniref:Uncharacterized protein n=1 Tax=Taxus chinensis TaxID=29808 RepID=A0AA38L6Z9_TAXCH|nr:hypothetical protein KI387_022403 [Taxus chinensis]